MLSGKQIFTDISFAFPGGSLRAAPQLGGLHDWEECSDGGRGEQTSSYVQVAQKAVSCVAPSGLRRRPGPYFHGKTNVVGYMLNLTVLI